jgi:TusA-related sulfurtransferase
MEAEYNLYFMHPQYGTTFNVTVDGAFTVGEILSNLRLSGFLPAHGAYKLARYAQELDEMQVFSSIENLESGDVLRIIAPKEAAAAPDSVLINIKLPFVAEFIQVAASPSMTGAQFVQVLCEKGILYRFDADFKLKKGNIEIAMSQPLADFYLQEFDLVQIISEVAEATAEVAEATGEATEATGEATEATADDKPTTDEILQALNTQVETLQAKIDTLEAVLLATRGKNVAADLPNPALVLPYESLEELLKKLS